MMQKVRGRQKQKRRIPIWRGASPVVKIPIWNPNKNKGRKSMDKQEIDALAEEIRRHNKAYWIDNNPVISDVEYDKLVRKLTQAAPFHSVLGELVEDSSPDKGKVKHEVAMLSLDKVFTAAEVVDWANKAGAFSGNEKGLVVSYKVDGSSCSLLYEDGKLVRAATRGDGAEGDDITANVLTIAGVPRTISSKKKIEVRGEVYMSIASFKENLARFEENLKAGKESEADRPKNPRNYCAGSLKQKDANITRSRKLSFMAHNCILHGQDLKLTSENAVLRAMEKLGFETPLFALVEAPEEVEKKIQEIGKARVSLPYETDGVVFGINRLALHQELGSTSHHPRFRLAFKFAREQGETSVVGIHWETSRTGRVAPTMQVKPISLGGATVTLCTVHNAKTVLACKLAIGDKVLLEREVIPYFVEKRGDGPNKCVLPKECGTCSAALVWDATETNLLCPNIGGCPAQLQDYIAHYVSRKVCNIMGVGETLIEKLLEAGMISSPADLYALKEEDLVSGLARQGESSAKKIIAAIQERREQSLATFLQSLGIEKLGETVAERVADHFQSIDKVRSASKDDLMGVQGVAEGIATAIEQGLLLRKKLIDSLLRHVKIKTIEKIDGPLSGKSFCLTGKIEFDFDGKKFDARPDIEDLIKAKGGSLKGVSKGLDFLIVGDDPGSKVEKAQKANVKVIDGAAFLKMLK